MEDGLLHGVVFIVIISTMISVGIFEGIFKNKDYDHFYYGCPLYIYNHSHLNLFGTIISSIGVFICIPLYYILWLFYWLCHVKRNDMKKPTCLEEVRQFIYTSLKSKYGNAVLSKPDKDNIVIDTETDYYGNSDVWIKMNYFH